MGVRVRDDGGEVSEYPPDFGDDPRHLPYAFEETAYWKPGYVQEGRVAHIVAVSIEKALCGMEPFYDDWLGSGSWTEIMKARTLPLCKRCAANADSTPSLRRLMGRVDS